MVCDNAAAAVLESCYQDNSTTKLEYEGVWKRKLKWVSKIRDPIKKRLIWLGTYATPEEASEVYQSKKIELQEKVTAAAAAEKKKRSKRNAVVAAQIETQTEDFVSNEETVAASSQNSSERMEDYDNNILVRFGPVIINKQGFILGEFSWIDDLGFVH